MTTANTTVELAEVPDDIKKKLTAEEQSEIDRARAKAALQASTELRLSALEKELSDTTKQKLTTSDKQKLIEEKGILNALENKAESLLNSAKDSLDTAVDGAQGATKAAVAGIPIVGSTLAKAGENLEDGGEKISKWSRFMDNPMAVLEELWTAVKAMFHGDFDQIKNFFLPSVSIDTVRDGVKKAVDMFDLSFASRERWNELLVDTTEFRKVTLEDLRKHMNDTDIATGLGLKLDNAYIKTFVGDFLKKENFEKISTLLKNSGKTEAAIEKMTIGEIISSLK